MILTLFTVGVVNYFHLAWLVLLVLSTYLFLFRLDFSINFNMFLLKVTDICQSKREGHFFEVLRMSFDIFNCICP